MAFPQPQNHKIDLKMAAEYTRRYRENPSGEVKACMFPRSSFEAILKQEGCHGIRIYFGRTAGGNLELVMVGVDANAKDMTQGDLEQNGYPCPPFCDDDDKSLNG